MTPREVFLPPVNIEPEKLAQRLVAPIARPPRRILAHRPDHPLDLRIAQIPCYVLEDGLRVLGQRALLGSLSLSRSDAYACGSETAGFEPPQWLEPFLHGDLLTALRNPIPFAHAEAAGTVYGYEMTVLRRLCEAVLEARRQGATSPRQRPITDRALALISAPSDAALAAVVDEATGYRRVRAKQTLAKLLATHLPKELQPWVRTLPYQFYEHLYRLRGWGDPDPNGRLPSAVGRYTVDLVYSRLAPSVYEEVTSRVARLQGGERKSGLSRWFLPENGHRELRRHVDGVVVLMQSSTDWPDFKTRLPRVYPRYHNTEQLTFDLTIRSS